MRMKKQVSIGLLSVLIAGGLDPFVGVCQTSGLTESSRILNEAVQNKSGEEKMPEETSVNADSTPSSEAEDTGTTAPKTDETLESSEGLPISEQETPSSQAVESSSEIKEATANSTTSEAVVKGDVDEQNVQPKATENIDDWMPDKNLQKIVSESLGIGVQDVTKDNIKTLSILNSNRKDRNINNLEGLQYATSLTSLQIYAKGLTDLSPIKSIASLKKLALTDSSVSDFSMFDVNTSLEFLDLSPSKVYADSDRSTDVETLYNDNSVRQISEKFPNLSNLRLRGYCNGQSYTDFPTYTGKITDVSPLAKLKNLSYLDVTQNEITDFSMLPDALNVGLSYQQNFLEKDITYFEVSDSGSYYKMKFPLITGVDGTLQNSETEFTSKNLFLPDKVYRVRLPFSLKSGGVAMYYGKVSTHKNQTSVEAHNSTLYTGDTWNAQNNFDSAKDRDGNPVNFQDVQVTGTVDTTQPGKYKVTYSYGGVQKEIEVTVLQNQTSVDAHNSTLYTGDSWNAQDNFDGAKDRDGNPVNFQDVQATGTVDTTQPGKYKVTYSYGGVQKEIEVTVLQKVVSNGNDNTANGDNKEQNLNTISSSYNSNVSQRLTSSELERNSLPSTGEKGSVWLLISGVMLFIFASALALLRLKKNK